MYTLKIIKNFLNLQITYSIKYSSAQGYPGPETFRNRGLIFFLDLGPDFQGFNLRFINSISSDDNLPGGPVGPGGHTHRSSALLFTIPNARYFVTSPPP